MRCCKTADAVRNVSAYKNGSKRCIIDLDSPDASKIRPNWRSVPGAASVVGKAITSFPAATAFRTGTASGSQLGDQRKEEQNTSI